MAEMLRAFAILSLKSRQKVTAQKSISKILSDHVINKNSSPIATNILNKSI